MGEYNLWTVHEKAFVDQRYDSIFLYVVVHCHLKLSSFASSFSAARDAIEAAGRCIFGVEPDHCSLLYYLMYMKAAGSIEAIISAESGVGGQEFKIKGGAWRLCHRLLDRIGKEKLYLSTAVTHIHQVII